MAGVGGEGIFVFESFCLLGGVGPIVFKSGLRVGCRGLLGHGVSQTRTPKPCKP